MKRPTHFTFIAVAVASLMFLGTGAARKQDPECKPIELSGRLHRPVKWSPQLEIWPPGQFPRIDLKGELIRGIKEDTPLRVRGIVRSRLHRGSTKENLSPFAPQWIIELEVTEVEVLKDVSDVLK